MNSSPKSICHINGTSRDRVSRELKNMLKRINRLIHEIMRDPFKGSGKPEPLKHGLSGYWSRRINDEHRIVYRPAEDAILIAQLRYHY